jgi:hypothetical protein
VSEKRRIKKSRCESVGPARAEDAGRLAVKGEERGKTGGRERERVERVGREGEGERGRERERRGSKPVKEREWKKKRQKKRERDNHIRTHRTRPTQEKISVHRKEKKCGLNNKHAIPHHAIKEKSLSSPASTSHHTWNDCHHNSLSNNIYMFFTHSKQATPSTLHPNSAIYLVPSKQFLTTRPCP